MNLHQKKFPSLPLILFFAFLAQAPSVYAGPCDFLLLGNKTYKEGVEVKSPMKTDPLLIRLKTNAQFMLGLIKKPLRNTLARTPDFLSDFEYLTEKRFDNRLGKMNTFYDPEFDTRFYHSVSGKANADGTMPVVDPEAKGLFIYIHGSGTNKSSGANFSYKGTELAKYGFASLSFDLPFHMDGSQSKAYASTEKFMKMIDGIIRKYRVPGQPVYLAGHSFGPEVVFEYVKRYPFGVDGAVALSPAAFNKELNEWFMKSTSQATGFWGDTRPNTLGGIWGGSATVGSQWNKANSSLPDPTLKNPNLKLLVLTGDLEEYAPGPVLKNGEPAKESRTYDICKALRVYFANLICTKEAGVGHYIFSHQDEFGNDIVLREFLRVTQKTEADMITFPARMADELKKLKAENDSRILSTSDRLAQKYNREPMFKSWFDQNHLGAEKSDATASAILKQYALIIQGRENALFDNIYKMKDFDPEFYQQNEVAFNKVFTEKGKIISAGDGLVTKYLDRLAALSKDQREAFFSVTDKVYDVKMEIAAAPSSEPKAMREDQPIRKVLLPDGSEFIFNMDQAPQEDQISLVLETIKTLRNQKLHREAQPLSDWLNKWVNLVFAKDKSLASWTYK